MKKGSFIKCMPIALLALATISCSNEKDVFDENAFSKQKQAEYTEAFTKQFGQIDPQHNWGFTDQTPTPTKGTRGAFPNANEWGNYTIVPKPLTDEQRKIVTDWFKENKDPEGITLNWSDFFIRQVSTNHDNMDHLICAPEVFADESKIDHVYGFNKDAGGIMFMQNSYTTAFGFKASSGSGGLHYKHVIIPGEKINKDLLSGLYFVGIDFESSGINANENIPADGYYSDWIVCVTPVEYLGSQRMIAEDLGNIGDFDFNDVVFDVKINYYENWKEGSYAVITLRAAGGTMPLTVGGKEVHEAFGVETDKMVNTGEGSVSCPVVVFRLPAEYITSANANDIPVVVENNGKKITLVTNVGEAPAKICLPTTSYKWTKETTNIKDAYSSFSEYVTKMKTGWWENPNPGTTVE